MSSLSLTVNGAARTVDAEADMPLLWVLRDLLGLTGTKYSCGIGACGACTVLIDGEEARACMTPVSTVAGRQITTIEGLSGAGDLSLEALHPLQRAWIEQQVAQCGYCQPGQIMAAAALLKKHLDPSDEEISAALSGVLCRCGMYGRILAAVRQAVAEGGIA